MIGAFDQSAHARMLASTGKLRALLLNQLIIDNEPLIKVLVAQQGGFGETRPGQQQSKRRLPGAELLEYDDAMQAGREALRKALEGGPKSPPFDPTRAKLSTFLAWKVKYELQMVIAKARTIQGVPRGMEDQFSGVDHFEDADAMERAVFNHAETFGIGELDVEPEEYPEAEPEPVEVPAPRRVYSIPKPRIVSALEAWLEDRFVYSVSGRVLELDVWNAWRSAFRRRGEDDPIRSKMVEEVVGTLRVKATWMRTDNSKGQRAFAGLKPKGQPSAEA